MPTYTYECKKCGHEQEVFHAMSAKPKVACGECGGACVKLIGSGAGVIFKGSGFYETDYKRKGDGAPKGPAKTEPKAAEGGAKAEAKTEAKSAPAPVKGKSDKS